VGRTTGRSAFLCGFGTGAGAATSDEDASSSENQPAIEVHFPASALHSTLPCQAPKRLPQKAETS
jgi:hypothetical protein